MVKQPLRSACVLGHRTGTGFFSTGIPYGCKTDLKELHLNLFGMYRKVLAKNFDADKIHLFCSPCFFNHRLDELRNFLDDADFSPKKNIIIINQDSLDSEHLFLPQLLRPKYPCEHALELSKKCSDRNFIILHNNLNIPQGTTNLHWIEWAQEWMTGVYGDWRNVEPVYQKNFVDKMTWISLNNNRRTHRDLMALLLLGLDLDKTGFLSLDTSDLLAHSSWAGYLSWWLANDHAEIMDAQKYFDIFEHGFDKIKHGKYHRHRSYVPTGSIALQDNFVENLKPNFQHTVVDIINEGVWQPDIGGVVSEKYLISIYAKNFPILNSVYGSVASIRAWGFDVFDDVINHAYDLETSPVLRMIRAIIDNEALLRNPNFAQNCWVECKHRFQSNVYCAKRLELTIEERFQNTVDTQVYQRLW